jgi:hypothetical protein
MIDKVQYLEIDDKKYPFFCGFNVLEELQDRYGSIDKWDKKISGKEEGSNGEISVTDLKIALTLMLNEGADIKETETLTEKEVGRLIGNYGLQKSYVFVQEQVSDCIFGKNAETTQEMLKVKKNA